MADKITTISDLKKIIADFINERDWAQFHSPKNLSMSIAIEAAELMEKFQWTDNQSSKEEVLKNRREIENELADVVTYCISFCIMNDIDLSEAIIQKLKINAEKYPIEKSKGKSDKYTKL